MIRWVRSLMMAVTGPAARDSTIAMAGNIAVQLAGFALTVVIAAAYGANLETDAFYLAYGVVMYLLEIARLAFEGALIPSFGHSLQKGREATQSLLGVLMKYWLRAAGVLSVVVLGTGLWVGPRLSGVEGPALLYGAGLVLMAVPMGIAALANSLLFAEKRFLISSASGAARPLGALFGVLLVPSTTLWPAIAGYFVGSIAQAVIVLSVLRSSGYRLRSGGDIGELYPFMRTAAPIVIGGVLVNLNPVVDRIVAAAVLAESSVTVFENAFKVFSGGSALLLGSVGLVMIAHWSDLHARAAHEALRRSMKSTALFVVIIILPLSLVALAVAHPAMRLLYGHGAYTVADVERTATALSWFLIGLAPLFIVGLGSRMLYSVGFTRIALWTAAIGVVTNLVADLALAPTMGVGGLALSTSLTHVAVAIYLVFPLRRRIWDLSEADVSPSRMNR